MAPRKKKEPEKKQEGAQGCLIVGATSKPVEDHSLLFGNGLEDYLHIFPVPDGVVVRLFGEEHEFTCPPAAFVQAKNYTGSLVSEISADADRLKAIKEFLKNG